MKTEEEALFATTTCTILRTEVAVAETVQLVDETEVGTTSCVSTSV